MFFSKVLTNWRKLQKELLFFSGAEWRRLVRRGIHDERRRELHIACFLFATKLGLHLFFPTRCTRVSIHTQGVVRSPNFFEEIQGLIRFHALEHLDSRTIMQL